MVIMVMMVVVVSPGGEGQGRGRGRKGHLLSRDKVRVPYRQTYISHIPTRTGFN